MAKPPKIKMTSPPPKSPRKQVVMNRSMEKDQNESMDDGGNIYYAADGPLVPP